MMFMPTLLRLANSEGLKSPEFYLINFIALNLGDGILILNSNQNRDKCIIIFIVSWGC